MSMTAEQFVLALRDHAGSFVCDERTLLANAGRSLGRHGLGTCSVHVTYVNLPFPRVQERRGGGAEAENNRMLFFVRGFNEGEVADIPTEKVQVEHAVCNVSGAPRLRRKTASPEKIASYLAQYLRGVATQFHPSFTHE